MTPRLTVSTRADEKSDTDELTDRSKKSKTDLKEPAGELQEGTEFGGFQKTELREKKKAAELGYLALNVVEPPKGTFWGHFNDRILDDKWVNDLGESFKTNLESCTDGTAMEVAIMKEWLTDSCLNSMATSVDGKTIQSLQVMEFTEVGKLAILNNNLWMLGGNHRRTALGQFVANKRKELERMKKEISKMEAEAKPGAQGPAEDEQGPDAAKKAANQVEEFIKVSSMWAVRVYDRGVCRLYTTERQK